MKAFSLVSLDYIALQDQSTPWFADFATINPGEGKFVIKGMTSQQKLNSSRMSSFISNGSDPFCLKICADQWTTGGHYCAKLHTQERVLRLRHSIGHHLIGCPILCFPLWTSCQRQRKITHRDSRATKTHPKVSKSLTSGAIDFLCPGRSLSLKRESSTYCGCLILVKMGRANALPTNDARS
ncbi:hypothetical protein Tco_1221481 [Tanacetum coccineum]